MRGKLSSFSRCFRRDRITPACAGKTHSCAFCKIICQDHPRVCGENNTGSLMKKQSRGSPPRVRGKHVACDYLGRFLRITPACAGKTQTWRTTLALDKDHPRVCGENHREMIVCVGERGSPPRVRGKRHTPFPDKKKSRITPACAGKTRRE